MNKAHPFSALFGNDRLVTVLAEVDKLLEEGKPVNRMVGDIEITADDIAIERAYERRNRLFKSSHWTLDQALALFIGFIDIRVAPKDDFIRVRLRRFCGASHDTSAMRDAFDKSLEADAEGWINAVDSCRGHFAINRNRMHPMLWMRWVLTYAPKLVTPVFWTELGLWRAENFAVSQPMVRGVQDNGVGLVCGDSENLAHGLMPVDGFIHQPMDESDFTSSVEVIEVFNGSLVRKGIADYMVSKRSSASNRARTPTRFEKARRRVGPSAMHKIERVLASLYVEQGKSRGWTYPYGGRQLPLTVKESRDELADLVVTHAVKLSIGTLSTSVTKSALSAFVEFPVGRRKRLS